jgi:hypothetical protein
LPTLTLHSSGVPEAEIDWTASSGTSRITLPILESQLHCITIVVLRSVVTLLLSAASSRAL